MESERNKKKLKKVVKDLAVSKIVRIFVQSIKNDSSLKILKIL